MEIDHQINTQGHHAPYVFHVHGELCHQVGQLLPTEGHQPMYAQLYIYDPESALQECMQRDVNSELSECTMWKLQNVLLEHH